MDDHNLRLHEGDHTANGAQTADPFSNGSLKRRIWAVINGNNILVVFIIVALSISSLTGIRLDDAGSISNAFATECPTFQTNHVSCPPPIEACAACPTCPVTLTCPTCSACEECATAPECAKCAPEIKCEETAVYDAVHNQLRECQSLATLRESDCAKTVELQQLMVNADQHVEALKTQLASAEKEREEYRLKLVNTDQQWLAIKERMEDAYEHIQKLQAETAYSNDHIKHLKSQILTFEDSLSHFTENVATSLILNFEESANEVPVIMENAVRSGMITNDSVKDFISPIEAISAIIDNIAHVSVQYMIKEVDERIKLSLTTIHESSNVVPAAECPSVSSVVGAPASAAAAAAAMDASVCDEAYRRDFALATAGATIVRERTSSTFFPPFLRVDNKIKNFLDSIGLDGLNNMVPNFAGSVAYTALGIVPNVGMPTEVLNSNLDVGSCWPMNGTAGQITVQLKDFIHVDSISIDHILRSHAVNIRSAPRAFEFYGLLEDNGAVSEKLLLSGSYDIEQDIASQTFPVTDKYWGKFKFRYFTLKILDNHGLADYTCIYRLRVHGEPVHRRH